MHSAKFPNEQLSINLHHAIEKYSIEHSVVNDTDGTMWNDLAICCWPTLVLIGKLNLLFNIITYSMFPIHEISTQV